MHKNGSYARDGKKVGEVAGDELTQENIMKAIAGGDNNE